jgi:hypothetical protein
MNDYVDDIVFSEGFDEIADDLPRYGLSGETSKTLAALRVSLDSEEDTPHVIREMARINKSL